MMARIMPSMLETNTAVPPAYAPDELAPETPLKHVDLSVVIPAYNEENAIRQTVMEVRDVLAELPIEFEIVVVDDGSTDNTRREAEKSGARVLCNPENAGYGAALKRGIAGSDSDYVAIIDSDGTYPPSSLPKMLKLAKSADMVVGDRGARMNNVPLVRRPAKFILNSLANYLAQRKIPDLNSGLRVFRRKSLEAFLPLLPMGFSFTTTITLCMICSNLRVVYHPIEYGRRIGKSKIRPVDFFNFILLVFRAIVLFNPLRVFLPLGFIFLGMGLIKLAYDIVIGNLSESAVLAILAAFMVWSLGLIADMIARLHLRP